MWTILYEDDEILAVDKPEVMPAIPAGTPGDSLREQVESTQGRLYVVYRLDKDVSEVMLFARTPEMHRALNQQFGDQQAQKTYQAVVHTVSSASMTAESTVPCANSAPEEWPWTAAANPAPRCTRSGCGSEGSRCWLSGP